MSVVFLLHFVVIFMPVLLPTWPLSFELYKFFPFYAFGVLLLCTVLFGILPGVNAIRVYQGKDPWKYPMKINFFK